MPDRVASDTDAVTTYRAEVARSGGTRRSCLRLPDGVEVAAGEVVRLALSGDEHHAKVESDDAGPFVRGAYVNRRLARTPGEGENHLVAWLREVGREPGQGVDLDEVTPGYSTASVRRASGSSTRSPRSPTLRWPTSRGTWTADPGFRRNTPLLPLDRPAAV